MTRPEVTGRETRAGDVGQTTLAQAQPLAFSIAEFCKAHRISVSIYFELKKQGRAPREIELGTRRIISAEAAAAWRAEHTAT